MRVSLRQYFDPEGSIAVKKGRFTEDQIAYAPAPGRDRYIGCRSHPQDRDQRANVLSLEEAVRRDRRRGAAPAEAARVREQEA